MKNRTYAVMSLFGMLLALALTGGGRMAQAQDSPPAAHPAHIHSGTCDALDPAPLHMLADVAGGAEARGGIAVESSATTVDAALVDIATGGLAINIHESADNIGNYIACGEIGTLPDGADQLAIGLRELNGSGYAGIATLEVAGEQTEVTVYLAQGLFGAAETSATAEASADQVSGITVDIKDFAYSPDPVTIKAGESITWTNLDAAKHTATAEDRSILQTGTLDTGASFTQVFDQPGTYEYFCEFHSNMKGTIVVE